MLVNDETIPRHLGVENTKPPYEWLHAFKRISAIATCALNLELKTHQQGIKSGK
jgi:hypothetical protein